MIPKPDNNDKNNYDYNHDSHQQALDERHARWRQYIIFNTRGLDQEVWIKSLVWETWIKGSSLEA